MIGPEIRRFIERVATAVVASTDSGGHPHLALGTVCKGDDGDRLSFENWLCYQTLDNVRENPHVAIAVIDPEERIGYQFSGRVVDTLDIAIMDGYQPATRPAADPQVMTRLVIRVEKVTAFCEGLHNDRWA